MGKVRSLITYEELYERLKQGPITSQELRKLTGFTPNGVCQLVINLTFMFPIWSPKRGVIKLLEPSDYENFKEISYEERE